MKTAYTEKARDVQSACTVAMTDYLRAQIIATARDLPGHTGSASLDL